MFCHHVTHSQGIEIDTILEEYSGINIRYTGGSGIRIHESERHGISIDEVGRNGIQIGNAGSVGLNISSATSSGIIIGEAGNTGVLVGNAGQTGIRVVRAGAEGMQINNTASTGIRIDSCGGSGLYVTQAGSNGLRVVHANQHGILIQNANRHSMDIRGSKRGIASVENHIARIYNFNDINGGDVLALKVNTINPDDNSNFITFFEDGPENSITNALGAIEGNGSGGITFKTSGADFAESLHQLSSDEVISSGDVVGVREGQITLNTDNADRIMVITDRPAIIGNHKVEFDDLFTHNVSFLGQVPVRVIGPVTSGDWIIPSAENNGTAKAIAQSNLDFNDVIIGQAWETNQSNQEKLVNIIVGVDQSKALHHSLKSLSIKYDTLNEKMLEQEQIIKTLQLKIESLFK